MNKENFKCECCGEEETFLTMSVNDGYCNVFCHNCHIFVESVEMKPYLDLDAKFITGERKGELIRNCTDAAFLSRECLLMQQVPKQYINMKMQLKKLAINH